jgi:hypothetical protein
VLSLAVPNTDPQSFIYPPGSPPPALREADSFVQTLIDQARACKGELVERCHAFYSVGDPALGGSTARSASTISTSRPP